MMLQYFQMLESRLGAKIQKTPDEPNARRKFALEIARLGTRLYSGEHRVAWCGVVAPFDMLSAMNVTSCFVEFVGAMLASTGNVAMFLEESEHAGFGADTCGYHRAVVGAALKGLMPVPDVMIATTCPCTGGLVAMENLARMFAREMRAAARTAAFMLKAEQEGDEELALLFKAAADVNLMHVPYRGGLRGHGRHGERDRGYLLPGKAGRIAGGWL